MARVLVAVEDAHFGPLELAIRRVCRHLNPDFADRDVKFDSVRGMGGFNRFAKADIHKARTNGVLRFGPVDAAMCVMDADRAHKILAVSPPPPSDTTRWRMETESAFAQKLMEWGAPTDFTVRPHLMRWSLESLFTASHELFASEESLKALGAHVDANEANTRLQAYLQACHPQPPAECPDDAFCDRWQKPQKCLDGLVSAVGAGSLAKKDKRRADLIKIATRDDRLPVLFQRVPDIVDAARTLIELVEGE